MATYLDFEKPIAELEARIAELRETSSAGEANIEAEIGRLEERAERLLRDTYAKLTPWQKSQVARHPERPHFKDYVAALVEDFVPLAGDRAFGEDEAIIGGLGRLHGRKVMLIGHEKGDDTASRLRHNFGMARPEGYRKAIRLMDLAGRVFSQQLDRDKPLWELWLVEGLEGDRFALYTKVHHSMMDGVAAMRQLLRSFSTDPDVRDLPPPWATPRGEPRRTPDAPAGGVLSMTSDLLRLATGGVTSGLTVAKAVTSQVIKAQFDAAQVAPFQSPPSMLNVRLTSARRSSKFPASSV